MAFVLVFCTILLFHFVQQSRFTTATQLESIARSVREPLSAAILKADIPEAEAILSRIQPAGIVSRADVVLPNQFQALRMRFIPERPVPVTVTRLFELPVQISLPIYSLERPANPQPLAYLVLQADSYRMYKFVMSALATLVTAYLLLVLMLTVALTWCINRLMVRPLRRIARELNDLSQQERLGHQLTLPRLHHDDEIGMLVRSYNRNQQSLVRQHDELSIQSTRFPVSELPNKAFLLAMLEQTVARPQSAALIVVACETLQDAAGVLKESQREMLLLTLVEKLRAAIPPQMVLAQVSGYDFAILADGLAEPWQAVTLSKQVLTIINERLPLHGLQLRPYASVGIAMFHAGLNAEQFYRRAVSAAVTARRKGKNQIEFFDPEQMEKAQRRLMEEHDIMTALDNQQFAIWLQPQVACASGEICGAEVLLRQRQGGGGRGAPPAATRWPCARSAATTWPTTGSTGSTWERRSPSRRRSSTSTGSAPTRTATSPGPALATICVFYNGSSRAPTMRSARRRPRSATNPTPTISTWRGLKCRCTTCAACSRSTASSGSRSARTRVSITRRSARCRLSSTKSSTRSK